MFRHLRDNGDICEDIVVQVTSKGGERDGLALAESARVTSLAVPLNLRRPNSAKAEERAHAWSIAANKCARERNDSFAALALLNRAVAARAYYQLKYTANNALDWRLIGLCYLDLGDVEEAIDNFCMSIEIARRCEQESTWFTQFTREIANALSSKGIAMDRVRRSIQEVTGENEELGVQDRNFFGNNASASQTREHRGETTSPMPNNVL